MSATAWPGRKPIGSRSLALFACRRGQLPGHAFAVLSSRLLVLARFQCRVVSFAALLVARLFAVAWFGRRDLDRRRRPMHALAPVVADFVLAGHDILVERFATRLVLRLGAVHGWRAWF